MERSKFKGLVILLALLSVLLIAIGGIVYSSVRRFERGVHRVATPTLAEVSEIIDLPLSEYKSCRIVHAVRETHFQSRTMHARLEMSRADAKKLIAEYDQYRGPDGEKGMSNDMWGKHPSWWDPDSVRKFAAIGYGSGGVINILVGLDDPDKAVLYISWFS